MNINNLKTTYDINSSCPPFRTVVSHDCDVNTRTVEVCFRQGVIPLAISKDCTAKAIFVERGTNILINDNVPCTITDSGSVLIPVDDLHRQGRFDMDIEVTITNPDGNRIIATPFPMWITVNASILNNAEISEESKGTVPELLKEAAEALAEAKDYENLDNLPAINGHELVGNKTGDSLGLQNKLTAGENITINANGEISASGGVTSYTELSDKPRIHYRETYNPNVTHTVELTMPLCLTDSIRAGFVTSDSREELRLDVADTAAFWYNTDLNGVFDLNSIDVNGYQTGRKGGISNLPDFVNTSNASNLSLIQVLNFGFYNGYQLQFMSWIDSTTNTSKFAYRYVGGRLGASKNNWKELSPTITSATVNQNGTITFTMSDGSTVTTTGESVIGPQGDDYVLTAQDKTDIANIVLSELPTTQGVLYGNANN